MHTNLQILEQFLSTAKQGRVLDFTEKIEDMTVLFADISMFT